MLPGHWADNNGREGSPLTDDNVQDTRAFACEPAAAWAARWWRKKLCGEDGEVPYRV